MTLSPLAKTFIFAVKLNREREEFAAWMATQKPRMERYLPSAESAAVIDEARRHWRKLEAAR
jgi:hypothetical protein